MNITESTVFLTLHTHCIGTSRKVSVDAINVVGDPEGEDTPEIDDDGQQSLVTDDATKKTDKARLGVRKRLLACKEMKDVRAHLREARQYVSDITLPFEAGTRMVPNTVAVRLDAKLRGYQLTLKPLVDALVTAMPRLKSEDQKALGTLYDASDYPTESELRRDISIDWSLRSFDVPKSLQSFSADLFTAETAKAAERLKAAEVAADEWLLGRFVEKLKLLREKLEPAAPGEKKKVFKKVVVDNLHEFLASFASLNVTGNTKLAAHVHEAQLALEGLGADDIKRDEAVQINLTDKLDAVFTALEQDGMFQPTRKFRNARTVAAPVEEEVTA